MFRLLFWIALIAIGIWLWRRIKNPATSASPKAEDTQVMVRCAQCNLHILQREALERTGHWYCSAQHRELGPRQIDK
jgi:uncharacterized protein